MLNLLIFLPLIASFVILMLNRGGVKIFSVVFSFLIFCLNLKMFIDYKDVGYEYFFKGFTLFESFVYHIGVDSISLVLMLLASLMIFLSFLFLKIENKAIVFCIFILEFAIMGLFSSLNALLFYIFWEFSLIPLIYIAGVYSKDFKVSIKFFVYAFFGSILMLVAMVYLAYYYYQLSGIFSFDIVFWLENFKAPSLNTQIILFSAFFIAFAIKAPLFPLHTWAPKMYANSPVIVSVMLVCFKMAPFGFLRYCFPLFPNASIYFLPLIIALCIVSIIYASLIAFKSTNIKELIAYSSISHIGVMILGIFSLNSLGISGAIFYMFAHGIVTGSLFLMSESLRARFNTLQIDDYHCLAKACPLYAVFFFILLLAGISLPLTISFVGEFLILLGIAKQNLLYALLAGFVIILGAIYMLNIFRKTFFMQKDENILSFKLKAREIIALIPVVGLIFYLGIAPNVILNPVEKDVSLLLKIGENRSIDLNTAIFLDSLKGECNVK